MAGASDWFSIGSTVVCKTCHEQEIEGEVLAFDPQTKMLILKCPSTSGRSSLNDVHVVNLSLVSNVQVIREVSATTNEPPQSLNLQRLNTRVRNQIEEKKRLRNTLKIQRKLNNNENCNSKRKREPSYNKGPKRHYTTSQSAKTHTLKKLHLTRDRRGQVNETLSGRPWQRD
ncbi:protein LSM12 homolog A isoform X2 [Harpegnathos saltator]|uniref:protein LSM12 homolog A isoform X2 n=1 Tax=Harpegnathos saltator TaxID=610380 RepID=UPI00058CD443|nr:protein LSM12 homolog A isoform X2 [Harpegnathos saltator]